MSYKCNLDENYGTKQGWVYLRVHQLHDGLLEIVEVHGVLGGRPSDNVVLVVVISAHGGELFGVRELHVYAILLHDALNAATANADDALVVRLRNMEGDLSRQLLLKKGKTLQHRCIVTSDVNEEVMLIESLELDLDVGRLHNLVDLAILLAADELAVLVSELDLEAYLVMIGLRK